MRFRQGILSNLDYWQSRLGAEINDIANLDQERSVVVKAISFGLDLEDVAWPAVYGLIESFSPYMERRGYWDEWSQILRRASSVIQPGEDPSAGVNLLILLARLCFQQNHFDDA